MKRWVVLVGMMGSGKSAVGRLLAAELGLAWTDLDRELERRWGSIPAQFRRDGEAAFRGREASLLARLLKGRPGVLSTGGGAVLDSGSRRRLKAQVTVYLQAPPGILARRLKGAGQRRRPLLDGRPLLPWLSRLGAKRAQFYRACARLTVRAGLGSPAAIAKRVKRRLVRHGLS